MSSESANVIKVRLEIEIPQGAAGPPVVCQVTTPKARPLDGDPPVITEPPQGSGSGPVQVNARQDGLGNWLICTRGFNASASRPIFARVYPQGQDPGSGSNPPPLARWCYTNSSGDWGGSTSTDPAFEVIVPNAQENTTYTLEVWSDSLSGTYPSQTCDFQIIKSGYTDCQLGSGPGGTSAAGARLSLSGAREKWAGMARAWHFEITEAAGRGRKDKKCDRLNGEFELRFDEARPEHGRWSCPLPKGLLGADHWRLQYQPEDGFWYLDYVTNLDQAPGAIFCYRAHESAWNFRGSNKMVLAKESDLCKLPHEITLKSI